jgi:hypothetical protein
MQLASRMCSLKSLVTDRFRCANNRALQHKNKYRWEIEEKTSNKQQKNKA